MYLNLVSTVSILGLRNGSPMNDTCHAKHSERKDTGWVRTSVKMLADLLLLFPPASHLAHSRAKQRKQKFHLTSRRLQKLWAPKPVTRSWDAFQVLCCLMIDLKTLIPRGRAAYPNLFPWRKEGDAMPRGKEESGGTGSAGFLPFTCYIRSYFLYPVTFLYGRSFLAPPHKNGQFSSFLRFYILKALECNEIVYVLNRYISLTTLLLQGW